jgi:hypothetical protein
MSFKDFIKEEETKIDYDPEEIKKGIEIEQEHKDLLDLIKDFLKENNLEMPISDEEFYATITRAHLKEIPDYNTRLLKMEEEAEKTEEPKE